MDVSRKQLTVLDQISASDTVRKKIIDAASLLYAKKGFTATSIEEISERAGVSLPVTHRYADEKAEIMKVIMEDVLNSFRVDLTRRQLDTPSLFLEDHRVPLGSFSRQGIGKPLGHPEVMSRHQALTFL
jgi:AcrR family transcriptional regulator